MFTYTDAEKTKLRDGRKKLSNNVYLERRGQTQFYVTYYDVPVVTLFENGMVELCSGYPGKGQFLTKSTVSLMNDYIDGEIKWHPAKKGQPEYVTLHYKGREFVWAANVYKVRLSPDGSLLYFNNRTDWIEVPRIYGTIIKFQTKNGDTCGSVTITSGIVGFTTVGKGYRIVIKEGDEPEVIHDYTPE